MCTSWKEAREESRYQHTSSAPVSSRNQRSWTNGRWARPPPQKLLPSPPWGFKTLHNFYESETALWAGFQLHWRIRSPCVRVSSQAITTQVPPRSAWVGSDVQMPRADARAQWSVRAKDEQLPELSPAPWSHALWEIQSILWCSRYHEN